MPTARWGNQSINDEQIKEQGFAKREKIGNSIPKETKKVVEPEIAKLSESEIYALNKSEQIELLNFYKVSESEIKKLSSEKQRVEKIMEVQ